ncbi:tripartite tricarboxylate transporter TctB family protein [Brucella pseudogrignonensis]|uniref:DUF1468 domain-containing protein n=1 Tax=Brucella pseudogrignonensis TaxID=419475 RepID=A0ABU1ME96_9HYPH|nr:tripartite tricarboxylate transporter TctB family protein [Brucella pseudogrignonensis]MDR6434187.1 hypothetical protein [Brucella pseudogrignonensis]
MFQTRNLDIAMSTVFLLFGVFVTLEGYGYGYSDHGAPGAGFFPIWIGAGILVFSAINLLNSIRRTNIGDIIERAEVGRVLACSAAISIFVFLSGLIGMIASGFLLMLAVSWIFGHRSLGYFIRYVAVAIVITAALYTIFGKLLGVPLL